MRGKKLHKQDFETAYIIHQKPYLERKLRLSLLCKSKGLIHGIANKPSKKKSPLQTFTPMAVQLSIGKQLATIHAIEPRGFLPLVDAKAMLSGLYFNELLYRLCQPLNDGEELFNCYEQHLQGIMQKQHRQQHIRQFEHSLQNILGYALDFQHLDSDAQWFYYHPEHGLQITSSTHPEKIHRDTLLQLEQQQWQQECVQKLSKHIFAKVLKNLLGPQALAITALTHKPSPTPLLQS